MVVLIYIAGILGWVALDRQSRRHAIERNVMCRAFGLPEEFSRLRVPHLESVYTLIVGALFCALAVAFVAFLLNSDPSDRPLNAESTGGALFGLGLGYLLLGIKALRENARFRREQDSESGAG